MIAVNKVARQTNIDNEVALIVSKAQEYANDGKTFGFFMISKDFSAEILQRLDKEHDIYITRRYNGPASPMTTVREDYGNNWEYKLQW